MQQDFLFLAEAAEAVAGKIHILGGGADTHMAHTFPVQLRADIALGFHVTWGETNQPVQLEVQILDADERVAVQIQAEKVTGRPAQARPGQEFRNVISIKGPFPIEHEGEYHMLMRLDGVEQSPQFKFFVGRAPIPTVQGT